MGETRERTPARCAFLTLSERGDFVIDDELAVAPARQLGLEVEEIAWDDPGRNWDDYELVVVRSTWDYMERPAEFLEVLERIDASDARLENSLELMRWNLDKGYLRELAAAGVPTIPTLWRDGLEPGGLAELFDELGAEALVVKQVVGAGAIGSWRVERGELERLAPEIAAHYADRALMAQPFVPSVLREGEFSIIYIDGEASHALSKTPKPGDYRSQEEYGSELRSVEVEGVLRQAADEVLARLPETPLYARVDFLRVEGDLALIELELVEPALYLRMDAGAPERFARALARRQGHVAEAP